MNANRAIELLITVFVVVIIAIVALKLIDRL